MSGGRVTRTKQFWYLHGHFVLRLLRSLNQSAQFLKVVLSRCMTGTVLRCCEWECHGSDGTRHKQVCTPIYIIRVQLTCPCSDTVTTLWCRAREHNKRSSTTFVQASHRQASCHIGTMHSTGRRHGIQETEHNSVRWAKFPYGSGRARIEYDAGPRHAEVIIHKPGDRAAHHEACLRRVRSRNLELALVPSSTVRITLCNDQPRWVCYLALDISALETSTNSGKLGGSQNKSPDT